MKKDFDDGHWWDDRLMRLFSNKVPKKIDVNTAWKQVKKGCAYIILCYTALMLDNILHVVPRWDPLPGSNVLHEAPKWESLTINSFSKVGSSTKQ